MIYIKGDKVKPGSADSYFFNKCLKIFPALDIINLEMILNNPCRKGGLSDNQNTAMKFARRAPVGLPDMITFPEQKSLFRLILVMTIV